MSKQALAPYAWRAARLAVCAALCLAGFANAAARQVNVTVTTGDGKPLQYAAVLATWAGAKPPRPGSTPEVMAQRHIAFVPHMLVVPVHGRVGFPNRDKTQHQVYSFSKAKSFITKLYIGRPVHPVRFDTPGVVTLGCNIHDQMQAFIVVSADPRWAISNASGQARLKNLPDAPVTLSIWQPWMPSEQTRVTRVVPASAHAVTIALDVTPPPRPPKPAAPSLQDRFNALAR